VAPPTARNLPIGFLSAESGPHPVAVFLQPFIEYIDDDDRLHLTLLPTDGHCDSAANSSSNWPTTLFR
jgi:hypothetical protein